MLEAKASGLNESVKPVLHQLEKSGSWIAEDIWRRVLVLAGESYAQSPCPIPALTF